MIKGYLWFIRRYGIMRLLAYEGERRRQEAVYGKFIPSVHGEAMLRTLGASEEEIRKAKQKGLA
jgi:hypothetical protein